MITAKYGTKSFEVSSKKIYTPNNLSFSEEINYEETEVSGKKPTITFKGIKLTTLSFEVKLDARFVSVRGEINLWRLKLRAKKSEPLTLGKYKIGWFFVQKVDVKEIAQSPSGEYTSAVLSLSFVENPAAEAEADKAAKAAATKKTAAVTSTKKSPKIKFGSIIKPKSGTRWYYTAEGAIKKSGKSGKAFQRNMTVTYTYSKSGKIVCVNPQGLGWLKVEDVTLIKS